MNVKELRSHLQAVRDHPRSHLYCGPPNFAEFACYLDGYNRGLGGELLRVFQKSLVVMLGGGDEFSWHGLARSHFLDRTAYDSDVVSLTLEDEHRLIEHTYDLLDVFLARLDQDGGPELVLKEHDAFRRSVGLPPRRD